ncbi:MAG: S-methyl-5'-thioadenosine phosphorylase [Thermodesulfovibrionales bacterium]|nr:S-methyl-5'-thioadenosine phosphorylase [Thermodesulfovibrionales bacterium]
MRIGLIGGSGLYDIEGINVLDEISLTTPYGIPSASYKVGEIEEREIVFLPRHGISHNIPPHKVNYRANIWGFKNLGVERIISVNAVGGINRLLQPGDILIPNQIIDFTFGRRISTFYENDRVLHVDFTDPFCSELSHNILKASENVGIKVVKGGTYICVDGPRLETAKEIEFFSSIGCDVVGMTVMPEAVLARELEICYSSICVVTNPAAGISTKKLTSKEVLIMMKSSLYKIKSLIKGIVKLIPYDRHCQCKDALKDADL